MIEWQDISTAPQDGTMVSLLVQPWRPEGAKPLPFTGYWLSSFWVIVNADMAVQRVEPTHWMALFPPPAREMQ